MGFSVKIIQHEVKDWADKNFPGFQPWEPILGLQEELGELSHSFLKKHQKIRLNEDHDAKMRDAVGDIAIFLLNFCNAMGYDFDEILAATWNEVKQRDWNKHRAENL